MERGRGGQKRNGEKKLKERGEARESIPESEREMEGGRERYRGREEEGSQVT